MLVSASISNDCNDVYDYKWEIDSDNQYSIYYNDPDIDFVFEDATIGKGHKGGEVRSNLLMSLSGIAQYPYEGRAYRDAIKNNTDNHIQDIKNVCDMISNKLREYVNEYTKEYEFPILFDEGYQLLKYRGGQQYKCHYDYAPHILRYLSALILLNQ